MIQNRFDELYAELDAVKAMSDKEACSAHNVDCKAEIIEMIQGEIKALEVECDYDYTDEELEYERMNLCESLGISRYC